MLWYTTRDLSRSFAIIGTRLGHLYAVDLVTGREIGCVSAAPTAIVRLEILSDSALDSTYLLIRYVITDITVNIIFIISNNIMFAVSYLINK